MKRWARWADAAKQEADALYLAIKHPRTPWYAKVLGACVVAYALSPIDLIPDPIPVLGCLDDLLLVPLGLLVVRWLIPADVILECRECARGDAYEGPLLGRVGAVFVIVIWIAVFLLVAYFVVRAFGMIPDGNDAQRV
jgi:uncharacterized membrane protein YkvA (DUF1232 family)